MIDREILYLHDIVKLIEETSSRLNFSLNKVIIIIVIIAACIF